MTTPDPVRARINGLCYQTHGATPLAAALAAVLDLHQPDGNGQCLACSYEADDLYYSNWIAWRCPTVCAIADALGVTP